MPLEIAESLLFSWLKHEKQCQMVQTNWKPSPNWSRFNENKLKQIKVATAKYFEKYHDLIIYNSDNDTTKIAQLLKQAEIDVLGISLDHAEIQNIYAVDVAFHKSGLNYGVNTVSKIIKKCIRTALCLYGYFDTKNAKIIFATPKVTPKQREKLNECITEVQKILTDSRIGCQFEFQIIANDEFKTKILDPVINNENIEDTNELFVRSAQLIQLCSKSIPEPPVPEDEEEPHTEFDLRIGKLAQTMIPKLICEGKVSDCELEKMLTLNYSKERFDLNFPVLVRADSDYDSKRYYITPFTYNSITYLLCNHWFENEHNNDRPYLEAWIKAHDFDHVYDDE